MCEVCHVMDDYVNISLMPTEIMDAIFDRMHHSKDRIALGMSCKFMYDVYIMHKSKIIGSMSDGGNELLIAARNGDPLIGEIYIPLEHLTVDVVIEACISGNLDLAKGLYDHIVIFGLNDEFPPKFVIDLFRNEHVPDDAVDDMWEFAYARIRKSEKDEFLVLVSGMIYVHRPHTKASKAINDYMNDTNNSWKCRKAVEFSISAEYFCIGDYKKAKKWYISLNGPKFIEKLITFAVRCKTKDEELYLKNFNEAKKLFEKFARDMKRTYPMRFAENLVVLALTCGVRNADVVVKWVENSPYFDLDKCIDYNMVWMRTTCADYECIEEWNIDVMWCLRTILHNQTKYLRWCSDEMYKLEKMFENLIKHCGGEIINNLTKDEKQKFKDSGLFCPKCFKVFPKFEGNCVLGNGTSAFEYKCEYCVESYFIELFK